MDTDVFNGFPTHIEKTAGLLKISVQKDHKLGLFVEKYLHTHLNDLQNSRFIPSREDLIPGTIGIGQFDDKQYYRIQILEHLNENNSISVLFIDYGNTTKLSLVDIRLLNEGHKSLLSIPPLAITCYLDGVWINKPWNDDELNTLKNLVLYEEKQCVVRIINASVKVVNIYFHNANKKLSELILDNDLGSSITDAELLDVVKRMKGQRLGSDERLLSHSSHLNSHRISSQSESFQTGRMFPTRDLPSFKFSSAHLLPVGSSHIAYISHMTDGPYSFSIQLKAAAEDALPRLTRLLVQQDAVVNSRPLLPGTMVMTRPPNDTFRRSIVMDVKSNMCQVYHADYGSTHEVPSSEIYELPNHAHHAPSMALRFCLADIKSTQVSDASKAQFQELLEGKQVLIRVVKQESEGPLLQYCEMFYEGRNVKDILVSFNAPLEYTIQQTPRGKDLKVTVSHIESPSMFYIQYNSKLDLINNIQDAVNTFCKRQMRLKDLSGLNIGTPVAALFEDNIWYRAMVLSFEAADSESVQVSYVDYGNRCDVYKNQICQISRDLVTKWRTQAVECCLRGFENDNMIETDDKVIAAMEETLNHTYNMSPVQILSTNRLLVELADEMGNKLSDRIKGVKQQATDSVVMTCQIREAVAPESVSNYDSPSMNHKIQNDRWKVHSKPSKDKSRRDGNQKSGQSKQKFDNLFVRPSIRPILEQQNKFSVNDEPQQKRSDDRQQKKSFGQHDDRTDDSKNYDWQSNSDRASRYSKNQDNRRETFDSPKSPDIWGEPKTKNHNTSFGSNTSRSNHDNFSKSNFGRSTPNDESDRTQGRFRPDDNGNKQSKFGDRSKFGNRSDGRGPRDNKDNESWNESKPKRDGGRFNDWKTDDGGENEGGRFGASGGRYGGGSRRDDGVGGGRREDGGRFGGGRKEDGEGGGRFGGGRREDVESGGRFGGGRREDGESGGRFGGGRREDGESGGRFGGGRREDGENGGRFGGGRREEGGKFGGARRDYESGGGKFGGRKTDGDNSGGGGRFGGGRRRDDAPDWKSGGFNRDNNGGRFGKEDYKKKKLDSGVDNSFNSGFGGKSEDWGAEDASPINVAPASTDVTNLVSVSYPLETVPGGSKLALLVSSVTSPHQIYMQREESTADLDLLRTNIDKQPQELKVFNEDSLAPGVPLLARFSEDQLLYRGIVKSITPGNKGAHILFVDYGNSEDVPLTELYYMSADLLKKSPLAYNCKLCDISPTNDKWPDDPSVFDAYLNPEETLTFTVANIKMMDGEMVLNGTLETQGGESVSQKLIDAGLAVSSSLSSNHSGMVGDVHPEPEVIRPQHTGMVGDVHPEPEVIRPQHTDKWTDNFDLLKNQVLYGEILELVEERTFVLRLVDAKVVTLAILSEHQAASCLQPGKAVIADILDTCNERLTVTLFALDGLELETVSTEARIISGLCKFPVVHRRDLVSVVHAEGTDLYIQRLSDIDRLALFIDEIYAFYSESAPEDKEWETNSICAAKSLADENWYRAQIVQSDDKYKVRYLDYGNTEVLPPGNLRTLDPKFYFSEMALCVKLPVNWKSAEPTLLETLIGEEFTSTVFRNKNGEWFADLINSTGKKLVDIILENNEAEMNLDDPCNEVNSKIGISLAQGDKTYVLVSHADSPTMFWVQKKSHIDVVAALQANLNEVIGSAEDATDSDKVFAAKYTADDLWYRATKVSNETCHFIDYGNTDSLTESKKLPENLMKPLSGYAVPMYLCVKPVSNDWSDDAFKEFEIFIEGSSISAEIINADYKLVVDLHDGNKLLSKTLIDAGHATYFDYIPDVVKKYTSQNISDSFDKRLFLIPGLTQTEAVTSSDELKVFISHTNSVNDFYVQEEAKLCNVDYITNSLFELENEKNISEVEIGAMYGVKFEDGSWYRAKVTSDQPEVKVLFVDFGNTYVATEIRKLPDDLISLDPLAIHCSLGLTETDEFTPKFISLTAATEDPFTMTVKSRGTPNIVQLLDIKGTNILSALDASTEANILPKRQKAFLPYIYGPDLFYVQTPDLLTISEEIAEKLLNAEDFEDVVEIADGDMIAALYPEDSCWYRGLVLSSAPDIMVRFVDYGNTSVITEHKQLPPELKTLEPLALKCSLPLPPEIETWSENSIQLFNTICSNNPEDLEIQFISKGTLNYVEIYLNGESIVGSLKHKHAGSVTNSKIDDMLSDNTSSKGPKTGYITHINSVSDFYIQSKDRTDLLTQVQSGLSILEENPNGKPDCGIGSLIAARFVDGEWYRGMILQIDSEIRVRFIDYGNECNVSEISALTDQLIEIPPVAIKCSLQLEGINLKDNANRLFKKRCGDAETQFDFSIKSVDGDLSIVQIILEGKNVLNELSVESDSTETKSTNISETDEEVCQIKCETVNEDTLTLQDVGNNEKEVVVSQAELGTIQQLQEDGHETDIPNETSLPDEGGTQQLTHENLSSKLGDSQKPNDENLSKIVEDSQNPSDEDLSNQPGDSQKLSHKDLSKQVDDSKKLSHEDLSKEEDDSKELSHEDLSKEDDDSQKIDHEDLSKQVDDSKELSHEDLSKQVDDSQKINHEDLSKQVDDSKELSHEDLSKQVDDSKELSHEDLSKQVDDSQKLNHEDLSKQEDDSQKLNHEDLSKQEDDSPKLSDEDLSKQVDNSQKLSDTDLSKQVDISKKLSDENSSNLLEDSPKLNCENLFNNVEGSQILSDEKSSNYLGDSQNLCDINLSNDVEDSEKVSDVNISEVDEKPEKEVSPTFAPNGTIIPADEVPEASVTINDDGPCVSQGLNKISNDNSLDSNEINSKDLDINQVNKEEAIEQVNKEEHNLAKSNVENQKNKKVALKPSTIKSSKKIGLTNVKTVAEIKANAKSKVNSRVGGDCQKKDKMLPTLRVRTSLDDKPVPGSISNPPSPVLAEDTPASPNRHAPEDKIVPGAISLGIQMQDDQPSPHI